MFRLLLFLLLSLVCNQAYPQTFNLGLPFVESFTKESYQAAAQNWDILQDKGGIMYFANADGLLSYDARTWKVYPLPNKTILRSIELSASGLIYAGGQNEFGFFVPDQKGEWEFQSLKDLIPAEHRDFDDVWDIVCTDEGVFFRSSGKLFHVRVDTSVVYPDEALEFLGESQGEIYVQGSQGRIMKLVSGNLQKFPGLRIPEGDYLTGVTGFNEQLIFSSQKHGFYELKDGMVMKWKTSFDAYLEEQEIRDIWAIDSNRLAIGTSFGGLIILEKDRSLSFQMGKRDGLLRNRILSLYKDKNNNLWAGLDNGITQILLNSPFSRIYPDGDFQGTGYDVKVWEDKVYFGTSNGLYQAKWKEFYQPEEKSMAPVTGSKGQVWGLNIVNEQILLSHNAGGFVIENNSGASLANQFFNGTGAWTFARLKDRPHIIYAGTYSGLSFFEQKGEQYNLLFNFPEFIESCRFIEQDNRGNIWISHPYRGIFRIELKQEIQKSSLHRYGQADGLPSDLQNHLFKIKDAILFCGEQGIFLFNYEKNVFEPYTAFDEILGDKVKVRRLAEVPNGDIWFMTQTEFGILRMEDRGVDKIIDKVLYPEIEAQLNKGFEKITGVGDKHVFITTEEGFVHFDYNAEVDADTFFQALIREVVLTGVADSLLFAGIFHEGQEILTKQNKEQLLVLDHDQNAIRFSFSATDYTSKPFVQYRFRLLGFNDSWSDWSQLPSKEYTNLSPGNYQFDLQARNKRGIISETSEYGFSIKAPWYANPIAYTIYALVLLGLLISFYGRQHKKYTDLQEGHDKVVKESEEKIGQLKQEKAETELAYKQRELVATSMHLVQKKEILETVKNGLKDIRKKTEDPAITKLIQDLILMLRQDAIFDDGWKQFLAHFNEMNEDFFRHLKADFPDLTPKDLKLCAYLRMNLSTKEMAALQNVTVRGIEASRYRLRKKFNISAEVNLTEFLMSYKG